MKRLLVAVVFLLFVLAAGAQDALKVYPTHWWTGFKETNLHLLVKAPNIGGSSFQKASISYPGVKLSGFEKMENPSYIILKLSLLPTAKPGKFKITINKTDGSITIFDYELKARSKEDGKTRVQGVTSKDLTYLIMPDRFANGDPSNDAFQDLRDKEVDRSNKFARHGGDLKGIEDHFDYLKELGVTALWLTPIVQNDAPKMREVNWDMSGYHGYWFTDHYQVDKRFGGNEGYKSFIKSAHDKGLKIIQDVVYNHISLYNWIQMDPPSKDWVNQFPEFTGPSHRDEVLMDPYGSKYDKNIMIKGWFVPHLPDLNLGNPQLATFLIQHAIWATEEFGYDGFRVDTYKYCDEAFLNKINSALLKEFPTVTTFVEAWANTVTGNAYYVDNNLSIPNKNNAQGALDFTLAFAMMAGMNQSPGWNEGVNRIYTTLAQDIVYKNPLRNCIFLDNHDMDRIFSVVGEDWNKMKWGYTWLLTLRGIPNIYYGSEILMKNFKNPTDAEVRLDFPGGWSGDPVNKFTAAGRNEKENAAFNYFSKLANFRKTSSALTTGNTMQFIVRDGAYTYFRYDAKQTIMVITNTGTKTFIPNWTMYEERTKGFTKARNVITGEEVELGKLTVGAKECGVWELAK